MERKAAYYHGLHAALEDLYGHIPVDTLADGDDPSDKIPFRHLLKAAESIFKNKGYKPEMLAGPEGQRLINDIHDTFRQAVNEGIADNDIPESMARKLDRDTFMFSGFKAHHELSEVGLALRDRDGKVKGYEAFEHDVLKIHNTYNRNYLKSEYGFAVASSQMAAKWQDVEAGRGRYDLQYRTANDGRVREEHAAMHGITLPADDLFWDKYYPPNGWRCRCTAVEVNKGKFPVSDSKEAERIGDKATTHLDRFGNNKDKIFRFNPGKEGKVFPPKHPYGKVDKEVRKTVEAMAEKYSKPRMTPEEKDAVYASSIEEQFDKVFTNKQSFHSVLRHRFVDTKAEDYNHVFTVAKAYAKIDDCWMNPVIDKNSINARKKIFPGITDNANPDLTVKRFGYIDVKSPHKKNNIVINANKACKQDAIAVITDLAMNESLSLEEVQKFTERIFSDKNVNQAGKPNYTKDEVHWYIKGILIKCNRPKQE